MLIELFPPGSSPAPNRAQRHFLPPHLQAGAGLDSLQSLSEPSLAQMERLWLNSRRHFSLAAVRVEGFLTATHAGKAAVQVGKIHVCNRHRRAKQLPKERTISAGKEHEPRRAVETRGGGYRVHLSVQGTGTCCHETWLSDGGDGGWILTSSRALVSTLKPCVVSMV